MDLNALLPYPIAQVDWIGLIEQLLVDASAVGERRLNSIFKFINLLSDQLNDFKPNLTKKERIALANLMLQLALGQNADVVLVSECCDLFRKLVKPSKGIENHELSINWRVLWELLYERFIQKQVKCLPANQAEMKHVIKMISSAKRFYQSIDEILEHFLPKINYHDLTIFAQELFLMCLFLPVTSIQPDLTVLSLGDARSHPHVASSYVPILFEMWSLTNHSAIIDATLMQHINLLVKHGYNFTQTQLDVIFTAGLLGLSLPGAENKQSTLHLDLYKSLKPINESFGCFIGYSIFIGECIEKRLERLMHTTETYFHPSNTGKWTVPLICFSSFIITTLLKLTRVMETESLYTREMKQRFVALMSPSCIVSLYVKIPNIIPQVQKNVLLLSIIDDAFLGSFLSNACNSLSTGEAHKCMGDLGAVAFICLGGIVKEENKDLLLEIMGICIQAIDINDPNKTLSALLFYGNLALHVPFVGANYRPVIVSLLRQFFYIFENLPSGNTPQSIESVVLSHIARNCGIIFAQCDAPLIEEIVSTLYTYVSSTCEPQAIKCVSLIVQQALNYSPQSTPRFIALCVSKIEAELESGSGSDWGLDSENTWGMKRGDGVLVYYLHILSSCCRIGGLDCIDLVEHCIFSTLERVKATRCILWMSLCIQTLMKSMLGIYSRESRSVRPAVWECDAFAANAFQNWVSFPEQEDVAIDWHRASEAETGRACKFLVAMLTTCIVRLQATQVLAEKEGGISKDLGYEIDKWFRVLEKTLHGVGHLDIRYNDEAKDPHILETGRVALPENLNAELVALVTQISDILAAFAPLFLSDTASSVVETCITYVLLLEIYLVATHINIHTFENSITSEANAHKFFKTNGQGKRLPRSVLIDRAIIMHTQRVLFNTTRGSAIPAQDAMLAVLYEYSICAYSEVRITAQTTLGTLTATHSKLSARIFEMCMHTLTTNMTDEHKIKGTLHLLKIEGVSEYGLECWVRVQQVVVNLCALQDVEKLSIQTLIKHHLHSLMMGLTTLSTIKPSATMLETIVFHCGLNIDTALLLRTLDAKSLVRSTRESDNLSALIVKMCDMVLSDKDHWWFELFLLELSDLLTSPKHAKLDAKISLVCAKTLTSDIELVRRVSQILTVKVLQCAKYRLAHCAESQKSQSKKTVDSTGLFESGADYLAQTCSESELGFYIDNPSTMLMCDSGFVVTISLPITDSQLTNEELAVMQMIAPLTSLFQTTSFWDTFLSTLAMEGTAATAEFSKHSVRFFKYLFKVYAKQCDVYLALIVNSVRAYSLAFDDKWKQKAATQILSGLVLGMKYWTKQKSDGVWKWLVPMLETTFESCTPEGSVYWKSFIRNAFQNRDPRRLLPLINLIFSQRIDKASVTFFSESKKLALIKTVIKACSWRILPLIDPIIVECVANLGNPYNQIRDSVSMTLRLILGLLWHPSFSSVAVMKQSVESGSFRSAYHQAFSRFFMMLVDEMNSCKKAASDNKPSMTKYINCSKSGTSTPLTTNQLVIGILSSFHLSRSNPGYDVFISSTLEFILGTIDIEDVDYKKLIDVSLIKIVCVAYTGAQVSELSTRLVEFMRQASIEWITQCSILPLLQILAFRNLFAVDRSTFECLLDCVNDLMMHKNVEDKYAEILMVSATPKRRKLSSGSPETTVDTRAKHSAILAYAALVHSFPYSVPAWMPQALMSLIDNVSDSPLITNSVEKCLQEFKRTHQDTWSEDKAKFSEAQLERINDLQILPSYFI